jgi:hypothetical protein
MHAEKHGEHEQTIKGSPEKENGWEEEGENGNEKGERKRGNNRPGSGGGNGDRKNRKQYTIGAAAESQREVRGV